MNAFFLSVFVTMLFIFFFWLGINFGIAISISDGAIEACQNMRWTILMCEGN